MGEWHSEIRRRLVDLRLRPEREAEIIDELSQHLDDQVRECVASGRDREDARREALSDLDAPGELARRLAATESRAPLELPPPGSPSRGRWLTQLWQDVRLAVRSLRRRPAFSLTVLATLALTIGPTTAIVSIGNWLLWTPSSAVAEPGRLAVIWMGRWTDTGGVSPSGVSYANLDDLRLASRTLASVAGWQESGVSVAGARLSPRQVGGGFVTANFFDVLGVRLEAGRSFTSDEDRPPFGANVVVVSHSLATQAFGRADAAPNQSLLVNGRPMTVVGVVPPSFDGATPTSQVDVWYLGGSYAHVNHFSEESAQPFATRSRGLFYMFIARLAQGSTAATAQAELDTLVPLLAEQHPEDNGVFTQARARVFSGLGPQALTRAQLSSLVRGLLMVAGVLLLLGCANVSNLLLSQGVRQQHERAVRLALGANRGRLIRQLLTESGVLAVAGATLGVGLAIWLKQLIQVLLLPNLENLPIRPEVPLDGLVLVVTLGTALTCGLVAGVVPAWLGSRASLTGMMNRDGGRAGTRSPHVRTAFAAAQLALSLALVSGAALLVVTMRNLSAVDLGFDPAGVSVHYVSVRNHGYTPERAFAYHRALIEQLSADPTLEVVGLSSSHPFASGFIERVQRPGGAEGDTVRVYSVMTTAEYPDVFRLTVLHGRYLLAEEVMTQARVDGGPVVISESLALSFFGRTNAVGERITVPRTAMNPTQEFHIVGVMRDARTRSLTEDAELYLYQPLTAGDLLRSSVVVARSRAPLRTVNDIVERVATSLDATLPTSPGQSLEVSIARGTSNVHVFAWVLSLLGVVGFALAAVGMYGLLAQAVGERRREFGVRLAIGASRRDIARLVFRQAATTSAVGTLVGLVLAIWGSRLVKAYLFGVSEFDLRIYGAAVVVLVSVVFVAALWPAWEAARLNPVETLRAE